MEMYMQSNSLYKSTLNGAVVECIVGSFSGKFSGVVVEKGGGLDEVGSYVSNLRCSQFRDYVEPEGDCKSTVNDDTEPEDDCKIAIKDNVGRFKEMTAEMTATFIAKNKDYGNIFDKTIDEEGYVAFQVRALDKLNRFKSILSSQSREVKDESILDTLKDLANYCIMCSIKIENDLENKKDIKYYGSK